jgi:F-type H+-transporting ATPase subunit delta
VTELIESGARVYAQALYQAADEAGRVEVVNHELEEFLEALASSRQLAGALLNPTFPRDAKERVAAKMLADGDPLVRNAVLVLIDHGRMSLLPDVHAAFSEMAAVRERVLDVDVTTAVDIGEDLLRRIQERIGDATGLRVRANPHVDPQIIGGLVLRARGVLLDASVRRRLDELHIALAGAPLVAPAGEPV